MHIVHSFFFILYIFWKFPGTLRYMYVRVTLSLVKVKYIRSFFPMTSFTSSLNYSLSMNLLATLTKSTISIGAQFEREKRSRKSSLISGLNWCKCISLKRFPIHDKTMKATTCIDRSQTFSEWKRQIFKANRSNRTDQVITESASNINKQTYENPSE